MKKILVPVDNSMISKAAVLYAVGLAETVGAQVILLSVINASSSPNTLIKWRRLEEKMVVAEQEDVSRMISGVREETGTAVKIASSHVLGFPIEGMIDPFVRENSVDLVVMGTSGAKGVRKLMVGTHTASLIDHSNVPVVVIPRGAVFQKIRKIVYATDMAHLDNEIRTVTRFARRFDAAIEILYVTPEDHRRRNRKELEAILVRMTKYPKIRFNAIGNSDVTKGVNAFVTKQKAEVLAMFTHKLDFFEKLSGKSTTRKLAFRSQVPLLAFNKTNI